MRVAFNVEEIADLKIEADQPIKDRDLMSPYVWKEQGAYKMLVRSAQNCRVEAGEVI